MTAETDDRLHSSLLMCLNVFNFSLANFFFCFLGRPPSLLSFRQPLRVTIQRLQLLLSQHTFNTPHAASPLQFLAHRFIFPSPVASPQLNTSLSLPMRPVSRAIFVISCLAFRMRWFLILTWCCKFIVFFHFLVDEIVVLLVNNWRSSVSRLVCQ